MRYDDVAELLPSVLDDTDGIDRQVLAFIESDLRSQAELARYRKLLRSLELLRTHSFEPPPGVLASTLAALDDGAGRSALRSVLSGRRIAFAGAIGGVAAGAAATAVLLARRRMSPAGGVG
jgi:hypothetical protein